MANIVEDNAPQQPTGEKSKRAEPTLVSGPIIGIPWEEMSAWLRSWGTPNELPRPKARRLEDR